MPFLLIIGEASKQHKRMQQKLFHHIIIIKALGYFKGMICVHSIRGFTEFPVHLYHKPLPWFMITIYIHTYIHIYIYIYFYPNVWECQRKLLGEPKGSTQHDSITLLLILSSLMHHQTKTWLTFIVIFMTIVVE